MLIVCLSAPAAFNNLAVAQSPPAVERIMQSAAHYHGVGCADAPEDAWDAALSALVQSVQVRVSVHTISRVQDTGDEVSKLFERSSQSASSMSIHGHRKLVWRDGDRHCAMAFVRHDSLAAGFERSKTQARSLVRDAAVARQTGRLGDALRNLYWAYLLTTSLPDTCAVLVPGTSQTEAAFALPAALRSIAEGLSMRAGRPEREGSLITVPLHAEFEGEPVQQLDFRYYRGHGQEYGSFRRGRPEVLELDLEITNLVLNLMHVYRGDLARNPDLYAAYQAMGEPELDLYVTIPVLYPWKDAPPPPPAGVLPQPIPIPDAPTTLPQAILGLLACEDGTTFTRTLEIYRRNGRLIVGHSQNDVQHLGPRVFLALVDPDHEQTRPVILATTADGYRCLRTQTQHARLSEFRGRRLIYLGVPESP